MGRSPRTLIIPAYNEERTIREVVLSLVSRTHVIVVSDGSQDRTAALAREAGATLVDLKRNHGYEGAINEGFKKALEMGFEFALTFDGDGQHDPGLVDDFFRPLEQNRADLVIGIRDRKARISEVVLGWYFYWRFGIRDPLCGMKAYRLRDYQVYGQFDSIKSIGTELSLFAISRGARVAQIDVPTKDRTDAPRFGNSWQANKKIFMALFRIHHLWSQLQMQRP